jgi:G:T-mismatch repair DNA endonuclease (very short patch repair protein)
MTDGCQILHGRNGREYRLPELPQMSVDGFCAETKTVYEFFGCYWHGNSCLPFRDVSTGARNILVERYEHTMARIEQITRARYQVEVQWECEFYDGILTSHPQLKTRPVVQHSHLNT